MRLISERIRWPRFIHVGKLGQVAFIGAPEKELTTAVMISTFEWEDEGYLGAIKNASYLVYQH